MDIEGPGERSFFTAEAVERVLPCCLTGVEGGGVAESSSLEVRPVICLFLPLRDAVFILPSTAEDFFGGGSGGELSVLSFERDFLMLE